MNQKTIETASEEFAECWVAAAEHLRGISIFGRKRFIRASLTPILLDHLSFAMGNQIFFVHVNDAEGQISSPSTVTDCIYAAELGNGVPCILAMTKSAGEKWESVYGGWGLLHAQTGEKVQPQNFVTDEDIELSPWELYDIANRRVINTIEESGGEIISFNSDPSVNPSIYFVDEDSQPHYVILSVARYPFEPELDNEIVAKVMKAVSDFSTSGFIATVTLVSVDDPFDPDAKINGNYLPLLRGRGYHQKFSGLTPIP